VIVRFSNSTGIHAIPDTDANANPRGMATRFVLSEDGHKHTDIVAHSTKHFPTKTGEGFLQMLGALGSGTIGQFLEENPSAKAFVEDPKPAPESFATEKYYSVTAFKLIDKSGKETFIRYTITPDAGFSVLSDEDLGSKSKDYLFEELESRLKNGSASFKLLAQVAEEGDVTDDNTKHWPEERKLVELGTIKLEEMEEEAQSKKEQQRIIFDPIPRVEGVDVTADPLLDMRASVYLISGRERRAAPSTA
jgi:catalase